MAEKALGLALQIIPGVCDISAKSICDVAYHWNNLLGLVLQVGGRDTKGKINKVNVSGLVETEKQQGSGTVGGRYLKGDWWQDVEGI